MEPLNGSVGFGGRVDNKLTRIDHPNEGLSPASADCGHSARAAARLLGRGRGNGHSDDGRARESLVMRIIIIPDDAVYDVAAGLDIDAPVGVIMKIWSIDVMNNHIKAL